jgi:uncharacterized membrane protein YhhN
MTDSWLWGLSGASALVYGLIFSQRAPSALRTLVKGCAVGALALIAYLEGGGVLLAIALAFCTLGDLFLAGDPKRWLPFGLAAFLVGHLIYIPLFGTYGGSPGAAFWMGALAVGAAAGLMLRALWSALGALRLPVIAYVGAIVCMVVAGLLLPLRFWPATAGALAFMASDAILSFDLFKGTKLLGSPRLTAWAVWFLYWGGQVGICWGMLGA